MDLRPFVQQTVRLVAEARFYAKLTERFPQHLSDEAYKNVSQHTIFFLMSDRPNRQIAFLNSKRGLGFCQLDVCLPEFFF